MKTKDIQELLNNIAKREMLDDGSFELMKRFHGRNGIFECFPQFKKYMSRQLQRAFSIYNKEVKKRMPTNKYWVKVGGHWVSNNMKRYTKEMEAQDEDYYRRRKATGDKYARLFYHYTRNKKSIKQRTKIWVNTPERGKLKGMLTVRWRSTAPHYHLLRYGRDKYGEAHDYVNEDAKKWMTYWEKTVSDAPRTVLSTEFLCKISDEFYNEVLKTYAEKMMFNAILEVDL